MCVVVPGRTFAAWACGLAIKWQRQAAPASKLHPNQNKNNFLKNSFKKALCVFCCLMPIPRRPWHGEHAASVAATLPGCSDCNAAAGGPDDRAYETPRVARAPVQQQA